MSTLPILVLALPGPRASDLPPLHMSNTGNSSGRGLPEPQEHWTPRHHSWWANCSFPAQQPRLGSRSDDSLVQLSKKKKILFKTSWLSKKSFQARASTCAVSEQELCLWYLAAPRAAFPAYHQHSQAQLWLLLLGHFTVSVENKLKFHSIQACLLTQFQHLIQVHSGYECTYLNYISLRCNIAAFTI